MIDNKIYEMIRNWDPMHLIEAGAPQDEYDVEVSIIVQRAEKEIDLSESVLAKILYEVTTDRFSLDPPGFKEECIPMAVNLLPLIKRR
jgi:hypothetical protein